MMKKVVSLVLALSLLLGVSAFAEEEEEKRTIQSAPWAVAELERAYAAGIFPEEIDPYRDDCTRGMIRAEFAAITVRLYEALGGKLHQTPSFQQLHPHPFTDIDNYDYDIREAYGLGFVKGVEADTFDPTSTLTREQACAMLARVYEKLHSDIPKATATPFEDDGQISVYAKAAVSFLAANGVVKGVDNNEFAPRRTLTVQEAVILALRVAEVKSWTGLIIPPTDFEIGVSDFTFFAAGELYDMRVRFIPRDATGDVTWFSADPSVASVSWNGRITAISPGTTTITVTVEGVGSKTCIVRCHFQVPDPEETGEPDETGEPTETEGPAETGEPAGPEAPEAGIEPGGEETADEE